MNKKYQKPHMLTHHKIDNVAVVVVENLKKNINAINVCIQDDSQTTVELLHDIPIGHKVALEQMEKNDTVVKYGQDVGKIVQNVKKGEHVHVHNMKTKRW